jgi:hypothetical protein
MQKRTFPSQLWCAKRNNFHLTQGRGGNIHINWHHKKKITPLVTSFPVQFRWQNLHKRMKSWLETELLLWYSEGNNAKVVACFDTMRQDSMSATAQEKWVLNYIPSHSRLDGTSASGCRLCIRIERGKRGLGVKSRPQKPCMRGFRGFPQLLQANARTSN